MVSLIIEACEVDASQLPEITSESRIIGEDSAFGLDSLDALELVDSLQKRYGVRFDSQKSARRTFASIGSLASFIRDERKT